MIEATSTPKAPAAIGPYSQAMRAGGFLFASGQIPLSPETGEIVGASIEEQAERCCRNVEAILEANGLGFEDVVKTTCFLAYAKFFTGKPARSCVAVRELPKKVLCEIEIIAACK